MTGAAVEVGRIVARYRLGSRGQREHVDGLLRAVAEDGLEWALDATALSPEAEVCVRSVSATVRLRAADTERLAVEAWSRALAAAIAAAVEAGGEGVAVYESRRQALVEMVRGVLAGDLRRAWAWSQLGLCPSPPGEPGAEAVAAALAAEPEAFAPLASSLARDGSLERLIDLLGATVFTALAQAAWEAAGGDVMVVRGPARPGDPRPPSEVASTASPHGAPRLSSNDRTIAALALRLPQSSQARRGLAMLAVLDSEPGLVRAAPHRAAERVSDLALEEPVAEAPARGRAPEREGADSPAGPGPAAGAADAGAARASAAPAHGGEPEERPAGDVQAPERDAAAAETSEDRGRPRATTRAAGLLFLIHVLDEIGVPDRLVGLEPLRARSTRWSLHRLGMALAGVEADDPAVLAFAGLGPGEPPPDELEPPARPDELEAVGAIATEVADALRHRLGTPERPLLELLDETCRRWAEIAADPGWIDAHLRLDEVSIPVRRAGLDLDPGFVPWLGVVVRFVYG